MSRAGDGPRPVLPAASAMSRRFACWGATAFPAVHFWSHSRRNLPEVGIFRRNVPRVGAGRQAWALLRNPFGIQFGRHLRARLIRPSWPRNVQTPARGAGGSALEFGHFPNLTDRRYLLIHALGLEGRIDSPVRASDSPRKPQSGGKPHAVQTLRDSDGAPVLAKPLDCAHASRSCWSGRSPQAASPSPRRTGRGLG